MMNITSNMSHHVNVMNLTYEIRTLTTWLGHEECRI